MSKVALFLPFLSIQFNVLTLSITLPFIEIFFQNSPIFKIRFPALHGKYKEWGLYRTQKWIPLISSFFSPDLFQCRKEEDLFVFQHFLFSFFHQRVIFQAFPLTNGILCCQKASKWLALFADNFYLAICNLISKIDMRTQFQLDEL